jgi:starvation-inducible outer membrane lipoprotein
LLLSSVAASPAIAAPPQGPAAATQQKNINPNDYQAGRYIVVLAEKPAATFEGGTAGLPATSPHSGR